MINHLEYVKKNTLWVNDLHKLDFSFECLIYDSESCSDKEILSKKPSKQEVINAGARVYGGGIGCTGSNQMIALGGLTETLNVFQKLGEINFEKNKKQLAPKKGKKGFPKEMYIKLPVGVHNLAWDIEFFKYELFNQGYSYDVGVITSAKVKGVETTFLKNSQDEKTFHIIQADNVVYGCCIWFPFSIEHTNSDGSKTKIGICLDMFDTYKIITTKLEFFNDYVENIDPCFYKMKEEYDYKKFRPIGHVQSDLELRYQYNDIYMLRKVVEEFYIKGLCGGVMPQFGCRTASSIAFKKLKEITFGEEKTEEKYIKYFEIDKKTKFEHDRKRLEKYSYSGGFTHANHRYINETIYRQGCSLDINSSYPSQMAYKMLPYGKPKKGDYGAEPTLNVDSEVAILEIGFDFVKPKKDMYDLAVFKIGALNAKTLIPLKGEVSGQEYFSTNIHFGKVIPVIKNIEGSYLNSSYKMVVTNFEYEFFKKHFYFGTYEKNDLGFIEYDEINFNGLEIGEVLIYKAEKGKFKNFVDFFTQMKIDNKPKFDEDGKMIWEGNSSLTNQAKLFLNSSYGKFGTKQEKIEKMLSFNDNGIIEFTSDGKIEYEGKEFYRPLASFVTAHGRLQLWNAIIYAVGVENFIYCDTDSIYAFRDENSLTNDMNSIGEYIDKTLLGKWDIESHFDTFKVLGQKKYMYHDYIKDKNKMRCCGLPHKAQEDLAKQGFDEFYLGKTVEGKLQKQRVKGGYVLLDTVFTIKKVMW